MSLQKVLYTIKGAAREQRSLAIIAKKSTVRGLETWLPQRNSTMRLCVARTGAFVTIEDYRQLEQAIDLLVAGGFVTKGKFREAQRIIARASTDPVVIDNRPRRARPSW